MNTLNCQHMFFTFIHNGPKEHFLFYCSSGSKMMPSMVIPAMRVGVIEEATVIDSVFSVIC